MGGEKKPRDGYSFPDNLKADQTPPAIARMFSPPVATVRRVLQFVLSAEL